MVGWRIDSSEKARVLVVVVKGLLFLVVFGVFGWPVIKWGFQPTLARLGGSLVVRWL